MARKSRSDTLYCQCDLSASGGMRRNGRTMLKSAEQVDQVFYTPRRNSHPQPSRDRRFT